MSTDLEDLAPVVVRLEPVLLGGTDLDHDGGGEGGAGLQLVVLARPQLGQGSHQVQVHHRVTFSRLLPT